VAGSIPLAAPPRRVLRRCHPFASTAPSWTASWCSVQFLVRGPSGRRRLNVPGALDAVTPELATAINDTAVNPEVACESLLELSARHVGLPATTCAGRRLLPAVRGDQAARAGTSDRTAVPAPNLNPIERPGKFARREALSCRYDEDLARFKAETFECLDHFEGTHGAATASRPTLEFQMFEEPQILAA